MILLFCSKSSNSCPFIQSKSKVFTVVLGISLTWIHFTLFTPTLDTLESFLFLRNDKISNSLLRNLLFPLLGMLSPVTVHMPFSLFSDLYSANPYLIILFKMQPHYNSSSLIFLQCVQNDLTEYNTYMHICTFIYIN